MTATLQAQNSAGVATFTAVGNPTPLQVTSATVIPAQVFAASLPHRTFGTNGYYDPANFGGYVGSALASVQADMAVTPFVCEFMAGQGKFTLEATGQLKLFTDTFFDGGDSGVCTIDVSAVQNTNRCAITTGGTFNVQLTNWRGITFLSSSTPPLGATIAAASILSTITSSVVGTVTTYYESFTYTHGTSGGGNAATLSAYVYLTGGTISTAASTVPGISGVWLGQYYGGTLHTANQLTDGANDSINLAAIGVLMNIGDTLAWTTVGTLTASLPVVTWQYDNGVCNLTTRRYQQGNETANPFYMHDIVFANTGNGTTQVGCSRGTSGQIFQAACADGAEDAVVDFCRMEAQGGNGSSGVGSAFVWITYAGRHTINDCKFAFTASGGEEAVWSRHIGFFGEWLGVTSGQQVWEITDMFHNGGADHGQAYSLVVDGSATGKQGNIFLDLKAGYTFPGTAAWFGGAGLAHTTIRYSPGNLVTGGVGTLVPMCQYPPAALQGDFSLPTSAGTLLGTLLAGILGGTLTVGNSYINCAGTVYALCNGVLSQPSGLGGGGTGNSAQGMAFPLLIGSDVRVHVTTYDEAATVLAIIPAYPSGTNGSGLRAYDIKGMLNAQSLVGTANYVIAWTQQSAALTATLTVAATNAPATLGHLIMPDAGSTVTGQFVSTGFTSGNLRIGVTLSEEA